MKAIIQHDERDCGAACLAMVAEHYGYSQSLNAYRDLTNTDQNGTSVYEIMRAAASVGLSAEALSGNLGELFDGLNKNEFKVPFIAHTITEDNYSHFVVVSAIDEKRIHIYDPAKGRVTESLTEFACDWTGNIITFVKNRDFKKQRGTKKGILGFLSLLNGQFHKFIGIIILSIFISGVGIVGAFAFQLIIDHSSEMVAPETETAHEHDIEFLTDSEMLNMVLEKASNYFEHLQADRVSSLFACLIVLYAIAAIIQYIRGRLIISMTKQIDFGITLPYFNKIVEMPISSVIRRKTGDYLSRYTDISSIREAISTAAIMMIIDMVMAVGCGLILYFQNTKLFFVAGAIILVYSVVVICNRTRIRDSNRKFMERNAYVQSYMKESIDEIETLKSVNAEECIQSIMRKKFVSYIDAAVHKSHIVMAQEVFATGLETIGIAIILWRGFIMVIQNQITLGELITFYALFGYLITPVKNLIELQPVLQSGTVAAERLRDVLDMPTEKTEGRSMGTSKSIESWKVSDVCFGYGSQDTLLKNITFSFRKGDRVALVGESGGGKTTLAKLFVRFFDPESGCILADGVDIKDYNIKSLRNVIAYVSNNTGLYSGTLYDNLMLGNPNCSDEWIQKICDIMGISDLVSSDKGKQFVIEEDGANLSSGQKQRIVIARALLRKPKLIILDEATSNLDIHAEMKILNAIETELEDITILMISHRISSIKKFDKIVVMQGGKIVEEGINDELMGRCKFYDSLVDNKQKK